MGSGLARSIGAALVGVVAVAGVPGTAAADEVRDDQWQLDYLHIDEVHRLTRGEGVTVAVIDSGVDAGHPDLAGNLLPAFDAYGAAGGPPVEGDPQGHGTAMAGLVAAHGHGTEDADGALGIAPQAKILPIRVRTTGESDDPLADLGHDPITARAVPLAIQHAVDNDVDIISISLGGINMTDIQPAVDAGIPVFIAIGNQWDSPFPDVPPGAIGVGAVGRDGHVADFSVRGRGPDSPIGGTIVLTAPGADVVTTAPGGEYRSGNGTSNSNAIVAGAAALVMARYPDLTGQQVVDHLVATAIDKGAAGHDEEYGYGDLDLLGALQTPPDTAPDTTVTSTTIVAPLPTDASGNIVVGRPDEQAADPGAETGGGEGAAGLLAIGAAAVAGACLLATMVQRRQQQPAFAGVPPVAPSVAPLDLPASKHPRPLLVIGLAALVAAIGSGAYAFTKAGDDDGGARSAPGADGATPSPRDELPAGDPVDDPPQGQIGFETNAELCFEGSMYGCDSLRDQVVVFVDAQNVTAEEAAPYLDYARSCGGRAEDADASCQERLADSGSLGEQSG
jgi:hypothetical protein